MNDSDVTISLTTHHHNTIYPSLKCHHDISFTRQRRKLKEAAICVLVVCSLYDATRIMHPTNSTADRQSTLRNHALIYDIRYTYVSPTSRHHHITHTSPHHHQPPKSLLPTHPPSPPPDPHFITLGTHTCTIYMHTHTYNLIYMHACMVEVRLILHVHQSKY